MRQGWERKAGCHPRGLRSLLGTSSCTVLLLSPASPAPSPSHLPPVPEVGYIKGQDFGDEMKMVFNFLPSVFAHSVLFLTS